MEQRSGRSIAVVVTALVMFAPFSIDTYLPSFPMIARELGADKWQLQQTLSLYLLAFALTSLVYGPLSDAYGRRRVLLAALVMYVLSSIGCALSGNVPWLLWMRVGQGLGASGAVVIGRAIVRDAFSGAYAQKIMSHVMLLLSAIPAVAPLIGGYLGDTYGWRSVFWFLAALGISVGMWSALRLPETLPRQNRQRLSAAALLTTYVGVLRHATFMSLVLSVALCFGGLFVYVSGSPAILYGHLGLRAGQFAYLFVPTVLGIIGGASISSRLAGRRTCASTVNLGFWVMLPAALGNLALTVWLPARVWTVVIPIALYAVGMAIAMPNLILLGLECFPSRRGLAAGIQSFVQIVAMAILGGIVVPLVAEQLWLFAGATALLTAAAALLWLGNSHYTPAARTATG